MPTTAEGLREVTEGMLKVFQGKTAHLTLVRGPSEAEDVFRGLPAGLYVGDYGHDMYGQYRTEVTEGLSCKYGMHVIVFPPRFSYEY